MFVHFVPFVKMPNRSLYFITGASRGLGEALAKLALANGDSVVGMSRSIPSMKHAKYTHIPLDLGNAEAVRDAGRFFVERSHEQFSKIHLVNNAGMIEPVGDVGTLNPQSLARNYEVNLIAPVILTELFLKAFTPNTAIKVVTNVTSGVARQPKATWAAYSSAKAGLNAFSLALADEHADDPKIKVVCYEPGIIDTEMQAEIRLIPRERFPDLDRFVDFKKSGALASPEKVAEVLMRILQSPNVGKEVYRSVTEG